MTACGGETEGALSTDVGRKAHAMPLAAGSRPVPERHHYGAIMQGRGRAHRGNGRKPCISMLAATSAKPRGDGFAEINQQQGEEMARSKRFELLTLRFVV